MGTTWQVSLVSPPAAAADLDREITAVLDRVDAAMSTWRADSALARFNRNRQTGPQKLPRELLHVVAAALDLAEKSDGAFDPTVLPLVDLWGFGPSGTRAGVPAEAEIERALARTGWQRLTLDRAAGTLAKSDPDLQIDLSAIAKGYGVDAVAARLLELGCRDWLVEVGGEVRCSGSNVQGGPWRIGIDRPEPMAPPGRRIEQVVELSGLALATSGDYRNFRDFDGRRFSHTIDPRTGRPVEHALASVSVIAADCMHADGLATAISVLGPEKGWEFAAGLDGVEVLLVSRNEDGSLSERMSDGFRAFLAAPPTGG